MLHVLWLASPPPKRTLTQLMYKAWGSKTKIHTAPTLRAFFEQLDRIPLDIIIWSDNYLKISAMDISVLAPEHQCIQILLSQSPQNAIKGLRLNFDHCLTAPLTKKALNAIDPDIGRQPHHEVHHHTPYIMCASYRDPNSYYKIPLDEVTLVQPVDDESVVHTADGKAIDNIRSASQLLLQLSHYPNFYCTKELNIINLNHLNMIQHLGTKRFWCKFEGGQTLEINVAEKKQLLEYIRLLEGLKPSKKNSK